MHITTTTFWKWFQSLPDARSATTGCGSRIPPQSSPTNVAAKLRFTQRQSWLTLPDVLAFLFRTSEDDITQRYDSEAGNLETHWLASRGFFLAVLGKIDNIFLQEHKHYYFYWLSNANKILVLNVASLLQEKESVFSTSCSSVVELSPKTAAESSYLWTWVLLLHQQVESISSPFWSHLTLTGFDQQTVARVTVDQLWASLLRSLSASPLVPVPLHALAANERSLDSASQWEATGQRFWEMRGHLGWSSFSWASSWMAPRGSSSSTCPAAEELPSWAQPAYRLLRNNELLF